VPRTNLERILESPLEEQEKDLRVCFESMAGGPQTGHRPLQRLEAYSRSVTGQTPGYLKALFCSNMRALLEILQPAYSTARSDA